MGEALKWAHATYPAGIKFNGNHHKIVDPGNHVDRFVLKSMRLGLMGVRCRLRETGHLIAASVLVTAGNFGTHAIYSHHQHMT